MMVCQRATSAASLSSGNTRTKDTEFYRFKQCCCDHVSGNRFTGSGFKKSLKIIKSSVGANDVTKLVRNMKD